VDTENHLVVLNKVLQKVISQAMSPDFESLRELKDALGEEYCPECIGTGLDPRKVGDSVAISGYPCLTCDGTGKPRKEACEICEGRGLHHHHDHSTGEYELVECEACGGKGVIG